MARLSILAIVGLAAMTAGVAPSRSQPTRSGVILLFGARWCAPCMAEYRDLHMLSPAAAPDPIALAWVDAPIAAPRDAPGVQSLPIDEARRLARRIGGEGYGLPFSVLMAAGDRVCAVWRAPLRASDIAALRTRCDRPRP